jgi:hypothetical protein
MVQPRHQHTECHSKPQEDNEATHGLTRSERFLLIGAALRGAAAGITRVLISWLLGTHLH